MSAMSNSITALSASFPENVMCFEVFLNQPFSMVALSSVISLYLPIV